jgi:predicted NBD/HSP70 family sugar kinase
MYYIGIDVSSKESALCILDCKGKIVRETKLPTTRRRSHALSLI